MPKNYYVQQQILLKNEYEKIFGIKNERPEWAVKRLDKDEIIHPAIPFVGKNYNNNEKKLLLYASAEVFKENHNGYLDKKEDAINRYRACFEDSSDFFPCVHIGPVNDGGLLIVIAYILRLLKIKHEYNSPRELLENISFANFSKFTIVREKGEENDDVAKHPTKLDFSLNYIKRDLEILKPDIIVMPKTIYNKTPTLKETIKTILPNSLVIPIYQIIPRVVNGKINTNYPQKDPADIGYLAEWQTHLSKKFNGKTNQNFYAVYTYLEEIIKNLIIS